MSCEAKFQAPFHSEPSRMPAVLQRAVALCLQGLHGLLRVLAERQTFQPTAWISRLQDPVGAFSFGGMSLSDLAEPAEFWD